MATELPKVNYKGNECTVDFKLGEMRCATNVEWVMQSNYGHGQGWEDETAEETLSEIKERVKEYRENAPEGRYRIRKNRIPQEFKTIKFTDLKEDKNSDIKKELRGLRAKTWHNDYIKGVDD